MVNGVNIMPGPRTTALAEQQALIKAARLPDKG